MRLSLGKIIFGSFMLLVALFAVVITTLIVGIKSVQHEYKQLMSINIDLDYYMLQLRRNEKDFLLRRNLKYLDKFSGNYAKFVKDNERLAEFAKKKNLKKIEKDSNQIKIYTQKYYHQFADLVKLWEIRGLNHNSGQQGTFRKAAHTLAADFKKYTVPKGMELLLTLRKHEKDFLLRSDKKYAGKLDKTVKKLSQSISGSTLPISVKNSMQGNLANYQKVFLELVGSDDKISKNIKVLREYIHKSEELIAHLKEEILNEVTIETTNAEEHASEVALLGEVIGIIVCLIGVVLAFFIARFIIENLRKITVNLLDASKQVSSTSGQLAGASQILSSGANEQASSIQETSSSLEEITGMVQNNVSNSENAVKLSNEVREVSEGGNISIEKLKKSMEEILKSNEQIESLVRVIANIEEKTQIMDEIVFQTKLLSFNASVEAERAGEHGRGFAVVAQEVGNLAQMSGKSAQEIAVIVKDSIKEAETITSENKKKVEEGNSYVVETATILSEIMESSKAVASGSNQVFSASKEQASGIKQINSAISQIDKATQENAATAEEISSSSEELNAQVDFLNNIAKNLESLIQGTDSKSDLQSKNISNVSKLKKSMPVTKNSLRAMPSENIVKDDWENL